MRTHYESLHVTEDAPEEVIRASYRALCLKHHPDTAGDTPRSKRRMQIINDAHAVLSDEAQRAAYDLVLRQARNPQPTAAPRAATVPAGAGPLVSRREHHLRRMLPHIGTRGVLGWLCDPRIVLPALAVLWLIIYLVLASRAE
jgi:curved DNA-binding protein CbpA